MNNFFITPGSRNSWKLARSTWPAILSEATFDEVWNLRGEDRLLKETVAELLMENRLLKKMIGDG